MKEKEAVSPTPYSLRIDRHLLTIHISTSDICKLGLGAARVEVETLGLTARGAELHLAASLADIK